MNGPARVILIAGWAQSAQALEPLAQALCRGSVPRAASGDAAIARTISVDALPRAPCGKPAFAGPGAPSANAAALASELARDGRPSLLIGWSMGGMAALETALHFPDRVAGLVLIASCAVLSAGRRSPPDAGGSGARADRRAEARPCGDAAELPVARACAGGSGSSPGDRSSPRPGLRSCSPDPRSGIHSGLRPAPRLAEVHQPLLILHGREDRVLSWKASRLLQAEISGSKLLLIPDAGHSLPATAPELVAPAIRQFLTADCLRA